MVTYNPDAGLPGRLAAIAMQCDLLIVVDNGSVTDFRTWMGYSRLEYIRLGENCGLAAGLNIGLNKAIELGFEQAVLFDQDSTPYPGMVEALWQSRAARKNPEKVAVVGPRLSEEKILHEDHRWVRPNPYWKWMFSRVRCTSEDIAGVTFVITSGSLTDLTIYKQIGPMDTALFIDYIDHEYCLHATQLGYEIIVSARAKLKHNFGAQRAYKFIGLIVRPTFHSALRLRYISRNRWRIWRRYALSAPHWAAFDIVSFLHVIIRITLFEDHRIAKIYAIFRGTWDGVMCRHGKIAD
jgi:rhamnosyltransferase